MGLYGPYDNFLNGFSYFLKVDDDSLREHQLTEKFKEPSWRLVVIKIVTCLTGVSISSEIAVHDNPLKAAV